MALFIVCRQGQQWPVVIVALVVYVVTATLVVRRQYVTWVSEYDPKTPSYRVLWIVFGCGVACVLIGFVGGWASGSRILGWFLFPGVIATYLAAGGLMTRARTEEEPATQWTIGLRAAALCAGLTLGALVIFASVGSPPGWLASLALLGLAVGLISAPIALSLLAERAIDHFHQQRGTSPRTVLGVILVGAVFALAAAIGISMRKGAPGLFLALVVLAALVFAIVSGTLADIFAALGIIALMGVTPQQEPLPAALQPGTGSAGARRVRRLVHVRGGRGHLLRGHRRRWREPVPSRPDRVGGAGGPAVLRRAGVPRLLRGADLQRAARTSSEWPRRPSPEDRTASRAPSSTSTRSVRTRTGSSRAWW